MKGKNIYLNKEKTTFFNITFWKDNVGWFIFPTLLLDFNVPLSPILKTNRFTFFFLKYRFILELNKKRDLEKSNSEIQNNLNSFLDWLSTFDNDLRLTKEKLLFLIDKHNNLKDFVTETDLNNYYTRTIFYKKLKRIC